MIDDTFVDTVKQAVSREYSGDRLNTFLKYYDNGEDLLKPLLARDMFPAECQSYYTEYGILYRAQHSDTHFNGDHLDVKIPFSFRSWKYSLKRCVFRENLVNIRNRDAFLCGSCYTEKQFGKEQSQMEKGGQFDK